MAKHKAVNFCSVRALYWYYFVLKKKGALPMSPRPTINDFFCFIRSSDSSTPSELSFPWSHIHRAPHLHSRSATVERTITKKYPSIWKGEEKEVYTSWDVWLDTSPMFQQVAKRESISPTRKDTNPVDHHSKSSPHRRTQACPTLFSPFVSPPHQHVDND